MNAWAIKALVLVVAVYLAYVKGGWDMESELNSQHSADLRGISEVNQRVMADRVAMARREEQGRAAGQAAIDRDGMERMKSEINSQNRIIAGLRTGAIQLRKRFTCNGGAPGGTGETAASSGMGDGAAAGGLQTEDVEFLVREAGRADQVVQQLATCQDILAADREAFKE